MTDTTKDANKDEATRKYIPKTKDERDAESANTKEQGRTRLVSRPAVPETVGDAERDRQHRENGTPDKFR